VWRGFDLPFESCLYQRLLDRVSPPQVDMVRKIGLVVIVLCTDDPVTQSIQATCCVGFVMVLNFSLKPFIRDAYDILDSAGCALEVVVYLLGISVLNTSGQSEVAILWTFLSLCTPDVDPTFDANMPTAC
jgi:hypothetical protein